MTSLKTTIGQITLQNPIILASGVLGSTYSTLNRLFREGFGAVTTKSIGLTPRKGHPNPSVVYLPEIKSILNAVGLANPGCKKFGEELRKVESEVKFIVSIFGSSPEEITAVLTCIEETLTEGTKPIAFELNLSCPHAENVGMAVGTDPSMVTEIVKASKNVTRLPIWIKLTPNIDNISKIGIAAVSGGAEAIVAINTIKALRIDIHTKYPVLGNIQGGLSGRAIKPVGLRAIYDLYSTLGPKTSLIGVGGVSTWEDVIEYILAGANAVQIGSILAYQESKKIIQGILTGLRSYLSQENLSITELRGLAHE
ncbi:MAG: dihydroorotate dehydrogenase [Promethearchaeota archaeon]